MSVFQIPNTVSKSHTPNSAERHPSRELHPFQPNSCKTSKLHPLITPLPGLSHQPQHPAPCPTRPPDPFGVFSTGLDRPRSSYPVSPDHHSSSAPNPSPSSSSFTSLAAFSPSSRKLRSIILLRSTAALSSALNVQPMAAAGEGTGPGLTHTPWELLLGWLRQLLLRGGGLLRQLP